MITFEQIKVIRDIVQKLFALKKFGEDTKNEFSHTQVYGNVEVDARGTIVEITRLTPALTKIMEVRACSTEGVYATYIDFASMYIELRSSTGYRHHAMCYNERHKPRYENREDFQFLDLVIQEDTFDEVAFQYSTVLDTQLASIALLSIGTLDVRTDNTTLLQVFPILFQLEVHELQNISTALDKARAETKRWIDNGLIMERNKLVLITDIMKVLYDISVPGNTKYFGDFKLYYNLENNLSYNDTAMIRYDHLPHITESFIAVQYGSFDVVKYKHDFFRVRLRAQRGNDPIKFVVRDVTLSGELEIDFDVADSTVSTSDDEFDARHFQLSCMHDDIILNARMMEPFLRNLSFLVATTWWFNSKLFSLDDSVLLKLKEDLEKYNAN